MDGFVPITKENYPEVARIYSEGIATGMATFNTEASTWEEWDQEHLTYGRIALIEDTHMLGWGSLAPVSSRCAYTGVAEVSVYVSNAAKGKGVGTRILNELITISESNGIWTLYSAIMSDNAVSIHLHKKCGFRVIGTRERIAQLNGVWRDNTILERRSTVVGV